MDHFVAFLALLGLLLSSVVHVLALSGIDVSAEFPFVFVLHIGIFIVFLPFVLSARKEFGTSNPTFAEIRAALPPWVVIVGSAVFAYAFINFALFFHATAGGNPGIRDGTFVLESHGRVVREITQAEYVAFKANQLRGFSGHWMLFYFVPFAYFGCRRRTNSSSNPAA